MNQQQDDDQWIEQLSGQSEHPPTSNDERQATALRAVILAQQSSANAADKNNLSARAGLERLLFRLKQESLLDKPEKLLKLSHWWGIAASVVLLAGFVFFQFKQADEVVFRGYDPVTQSTHIDSQTPAVTARKIRHSLTDIQVEATIYQTGQQWFLQARILPEQRKTVEELLSEYRIKLPENGHLLLEISPTEQNKSS